jgi:hypothetical protein
MRNLSLGLVLLVIATAQERPKPSPEIQALLDAAPAAPPELAGDILLRLVDSGQIPSKDQRVELIETAFRMAGLAKFPYSQTAAVGRAGNTDSSPGIRWGANGFSTLGLQCRAVRAALALEKAKAIELFRQIMIGPFLPLSCDDALAPSLSEYYEILREVALNAYPPKDRKEGRHLELIEEAVRKVAITRQLEPVARLLATFPLPLERKIQFAGTYAAALKQMSADPRSFGAETLGFGQAILGLSKSLRTDGISTIPLVDAFSTYLTRHLRGAVCAETADPSEGGLIMRQMVDKVLNDGLLAPSGATEIAPLRFEELKPASVEGRAKFSEYWREGRSREIMARYKALRFGTKEQQEEYNKRERRKDGMAHFLPDELRRTPEWETAARQFLNELDRWSKNHDEPEIDFFHQICTQYGALLDIIPSGRLHDTVLQTYVSFLKTSPLERESPPEWLFHLKRLFTITDATPERLQWVRDEVRKNGSLTMSVYAELDRLDAKRRKS